MHQMPPGDTDAVLAIALARDIEDERRRHARQLSIALACTRAARALIEDNADKDLEQQKDAETLRRIYALLLDISMGISPAAGALAAEVQKLEMVSTLEQAATERPAALRLVK